MSSQSNDLLDGALDLAVNRGWRVFPQRGKVALVKWGTLATDEPDTIAEWWGLKFRGANVGVSCGPSGLLVVDLDRPDGPKSWAALTKQYGPAPTNLRAQSGGGGYHFVYALEPGHTISGRASRLLGPGIDVKGAGQCFTVAPSVHGSGKPYRWLSNGDPAPAPAWLLERLADRPKPEPSTATPADADGTPYGLAAVRRSVEQMRAAPKGSRNETLNAIAFSLGRLVAGGEVSEAFVRFELHQAALAAWAATSERPEGKEVKATIDSGIAAGALQPRSAPPRPGREGNGSRLRRWTVR